MKQVVKIIYYVHTFTVQPQFFEGDAQYGGLNWPDGFHISKGAHCSHISDNARTIKHPYIGVRTRGWSCFSKDP